MYLTKLLIHWKGTSRTAAPNQANGQE